MAYEGIFLRKTIGQQPGIPEAIWNESPDVLCVGANILPDPSVPVTEYNTLFLNTLAADVDNFVYVRGINMSSETVTARIWVWNVITLLTWELGLPIPLMNPVTQSNYIDITAGPGEVFITNPPFVWQPMFIPAYYSVVAKVESPPLSSPPQAPMPYDIGQSYAVLMFEVSADPTIGWTVVPPSLEPSYPTQQFVIPVTWPNVTETGYLGVDCSNMPTDSFVSFSAPGPDAANSIIVENYPIASDNFLLSLPVEWPPNYESELIISWKVGSTPAPSGSKISAILAFPLSSDDADSVKVKAVQVIEDTNSQTTSEKLLQVVDVPVYIIH